MNDALLISQSFQVKTGKSFELGKQWFSRFP